MFASACTGGPQGGGAQASTPPPPRRAARMLPIHYPHGTKDRTKNAIRDFVTRVTKEGSADFVPAPERIATFDNDGTLWTEKPLPFQLLFALDRVKALAPQHPDWTTKQPFASLLKGDMAGLMASRRKGVLEIMAATHAGMTTDEFAADRAGVDHHARSIRRPGGCTPRWSISRWSNCSPICARNGFKTFIVVGRRRRVHARVDGTGLRHPAGAGDRQRRQVEVRDARRHTGADQAARDRFHRRQGRQADRHPEPDRPPSHRRVRQLRWRPADAAVDHGRQRRAVCRSSFITTMRRASSPTTATDKLQQFDKGWDEAVAKGWTVVSMKNDWKTVFPPVK